MVESTTGVGKLKVLNSFSKKKEEFIPENAEEITWYVCGPTVYDDSHMGHARNYVQWDIIRRIMTEYFGYNIKLCMNITDLDDKIIRKAIEQEKDFGEISRHFETSFLDDMKLLNVALPDVITRVSEYMDEIIEFIEKIIKNGYAYESNGSVFFDTQKFSNHPNHSYAKLEPESVNDAEKMQEGEGVLTETKEYTKKNERDFALWKKSKPGEPKWNSKWGEGRPGWHIECSAMAEAIFKKAPLDIHSGGIDLRFPHHDNEIAQSEAYHDCDNWINNFWHCGHLHIDGKKMSKSLKNFITIKDVLKTYSSSQIRFVFLLHYWNTTMNYSTENSFKEATAKEDQFKQFFRLVGSKIRDIELKNTDQKWTDKDHALSDCLLKGKSAVRTALCDSFDTPNAVNALSDLVIATNTYLKQADNLIKVPLVRQISKFVFQTLKAFGVYEEGDLPSLTGGKSPEEVIKPVMDAFRDYRDVVKNKAGEDKKELLQLSDQLRDEILPKLGVLLKDMGGDDKATWNFVDPKELMEELEKATIDKANKAAKKKADEELKLTKKSCPSVDWFKVHNGFQDKENYTQFDDQGIPTHWIKPEKKGPDKGKKVEQDVPKEQRTKCQKELVKQEKVYQKWLEEKDKPVPEKQEEKKTKPAGVPNTDSHASTGGQMDQIRALKAQIEKIDEMSREQVYADPIRKIQEEHYKQLLSLRDGLHSTVKEALDIVEQGGSGSGAGVQAPVGGQASNEVMAKLVEDNKKLNYRIVHLLRALEKDEEKPVTTHTQEEAKTEASSVAEEPGEEKKDESSVQSKKKNKKKK